MNAVIKQKGFRNDGSYYYGDVVSNPKMQEEQCVENSQKAFQLTEETCLQDYYGRHIIPGTLGELELFFEDES